MVKCVYVYLGPGPTHNSPQARLGNHRMSKENKLEELKHEKEYKHENNFPAVFPYEGKAAIMAELNRVSGIVPGSQGYSENQEMNRVSGSQGYLENEVLKTELNLDEFAEEHIDNMVDSQQSDFRKTNKVYLYRYIYIGIFMFSNFFFMTLPKLRFLLF